MEICALAPDGDLGRLRKLCRGWEGEKPPRLEKEKRKNRGILEDESRAAPTLVARGTLASGALPEMRRAQRAAPCHPGREQGCSKVRPIAAKAAPAALKSEGRKPKPERNPKPEIRKGLQPLTGPTASAASLSGLRFSGFLRVSVFGLRIWAGSDRLQSTPGLGTPSALLSCFSRRRYVPWRRFRT
jgi:hypothetical protein